MGHCPRQSKSIGGKRYSLFTGLAAEVEHILYGLYNVEKIEFAGVRGYQGEPKVKLPRRWSCVLVSIVVCDRELGEREIRVKTSKPGAILRILQRTLERRKIVVCL